MVLATVSIAATALAASGTAAAGAVAPATPNSSSITTRAATTTDGGISTSKALCGIAKIGAAGEAGRRLKTYGSSRGIVGAILADLFLSSVEVHCESVADRAGSIVLRMFRDERRPSSQQSTRSTILSLLDVQSAAQIAAKVVVNGAPVSARYITAGADETCQALRNRSAPISVVSRYFPGARLNVIEPMNGFVRLVVTRCPLNAYGANFLSGEMLNYLLSNESSRDLEPPSVWVYSATGTRYTNGTAELNASWIGSDRRSGIKAYVVWMWREGAWYQLAPSTGSTGWRITLRQGTRYQWAVRAIDQAGNASPWSYSNVYAA